MSSIRSALPICIVIGLVSAAHAQSAEPIAFDIEAQDLATALKLFALQSGRDVMFAPQTAARLKSTKVQGTLDLIAALRALLEGTGLKYEITDTAAIVV